MPTLILRVKKIVLTPGVKFNQMKKLILLIAILSIVSCKSTKAPAPTPEDSPATTSFFIEDLSAMNASEIKVAYADAKPVEDTGMFDEGTEERAYIILYPETPDEIHITWEDAEKTQIHDIRFSETGKWSSKTGIVVGTTYDELNKLNEKEISFYGFGWDYSGAVDWNGGKLENSDLFVFLEAKNIPGKFYGDFIIKATPEEIRNMDLRVKTIMYKR